MVIEIKPKVRTKIDLGSLHPGDCFVRCDLKYRNPSYWIVTEQDTSSQICCVNLENGSSRYLHNKTLVVPVVIEAVADY